MSQPSCTVRKAVTPCGRGGVGQVVEFVLGGEVVLDHRAGGAGGAGHHLRQPVIGLRAEHDIDPRGAGGDLAPLRLGDAAGDGQHHLAARGALRALASRSRPSSEKSFSVAFSRIWQVLRMTMSAPSGVSAGA